MTIIDTFCNLIWWIEFGLRYSRIGWIELSIRMFVIVWLRYKQMVLLGVETQISADELDNSSEMWAYDSSEA